MAPARGPAAGVTVGFDRAQQGVIGDDVGVADPLDGIDIAHAEGEVRPREGMDVGHLLPDDGIARPNRQEEAHLGDVGRVGGDAVQRTRRVDRVHDRIEDREDGDARAQQRHLDHGYVMEAFGRDRARQRVQRHLDVVEHGGAGVADCETSASGHRCAALPRPVSRTGSWPAASRSARTAGRS